MSLASILQGYSQDISSSTQHAADQGDEIANRKAVGTDEHLQHIIDTFNSSATELGTASMGVHLGRKIYTKYKTARNAAQKIRDAASNLSGKANPTAATGDTGSIPGSQTLEESRAARAKISGGDPAATVADSGDGTPGSARGPESVGTKAPDSGASDIAPSPDATLTDAGDVGGASAAPAAPAVPAAPTDTGSAPGAGDTATFTKSTGTAGVDPDAAPQGLFQAKPAGAAPASVTAEQQANLQAKTAGQTASEGAQDLTGAQTLGQPVKVLPTQQAAPDSAGIGSTPDATPQIQPQDMGGAPSSANDNTAGRRFAKLLRTDPNVNVNQGGSPLQKLHDPASGGTTSGDVAPGGSDSIPLKGGAGSLETTGADSENLLGGDAAAGNMQKQVVSKLAGKVATGAGEDAGEIAGTIGLDGFLDTIPIFGEIASVVTGIMGIVKASKKPTTEEDKPNVVAETSGGQVGGVDTSALMKTNAGAVTTIV